jgi:hypothetical protein
VEDPYRGEIWTYHDDVETEFVVAFGTNTSRFWFDDNGHIMYWDREQRNWLGQADGFQGWCPYIRRREQDVTREEGAEIEDEDEPAQESDESMSEGGVDGEGGEGDGGDGGEKDGSVRSGGKSPTQDGWWSPPPSPPPETDRRDYDGY